jgi:hypothetical protein
MVVRSVIAYRRCLDLSISYLVGSSKGLRAGTVRSNRMRAANTSRAFACSKLRSLERCLVEVRSTKGRSAHLTSNSGATTVASLARCSNPGFGEVHRASPARRPYQVGLLP